MTQIPITVYALALSPFVVKVRCFLNFKNLDYQVVYVNPMKQRQELQFSGQSLVPVVCIGEKVLVDSTPIGIELDKLYPESQRLLPEEQDMRQQLLELDQWLSEELIPLSFRASQEVPIGVHLKNASISSNMVHQTTPGGIPLWLRLVWPIVIRRLSPHLRQMSERSGNSLGLEEAQHQVCVEFSSRLEGGPFLLGRTTPALPDCSAYAFFMLTYIAGLDGYSSFHEFDEIRSWIRRMTPLVFSPRPFVEEGLIRRMPIVVLRQLLLCFPVRRQMCISLPT